MVSGRGGASKVGEGPDRTRVVVEIERPLGVHLEPAMAAILVRRHPDVVADLEAWGRRLAATGDARLLDSVAQLRESARQYQAWARGAGRGNAAVPKGPSRRESGSSSSERVLSPGEVAERLRQAGFVVRERQVRNMCAGSSESVLSATSVGGRWLIDAVSVDLEIARRQEKADG